MRDQGWLKLHRKIENWELYFSEPFTRAHAWIDLLILTNHAPGTISVRGNIVRIGRGETAWSEDALARRWRWSRGKVRRFLSWLETVQQIRIEKNAIISKIIIVNYDHYQPDDTSGGTTDGQQTDTNKNEKKNKKEKKPVGAEAGGPPPAVDGAQDAKPGKTDGVAEAIVQVLDAFRKSVNPTISFANRTERDAAKALVAEFGLESVLRAVAYAASIRGEPYAPEVFKPSDLARKWPNLANHKNKAQRPPADGQGPRSGARKLHDGTEAIMFNGRWVDADNRSVAIDLSYYPELTK